LVNFIEEQGGGATPPCYHRKMQRQAIYLAHKNKWEVDGLFAKIKKSPVLPRELAPIWIGHPA
jgi:hypothetical protein